jgi:hypothetical protein
MSGNKLQYFNFTKEQFNPNNKHHMKIAREFFRDYRWGPSGCLFILEWPYEDIPYMLKTKITEYTLEALK